MSAHAWYFDGKSSRRHSVALTLTNGIVVLGGDIERTMPLQELQISERTRAAPRKIRFPDGAYLEVVDNDLFTSMLSGNGHPESLTVRMQQNWSLTLAALAATILLLTVTYLYGLPAAAKIIALHMPVKVERSIGRETLGFLDKQILAPSRLPAQRKQQIMTRFNALVLPRDDTPAAQLVFRQSRIGPNAFALPSGQIVVTDEIIELADDDAIMGVLAHELGHLHKRHLLRRLIQGSAIGIAGMALFGDVSSVVANIPAMMLDLKYSRDAEREADDYAIIVMKANHLDPGKLADLFEKLARKTGNDPMPYLSTHPATSERIARIRHS